MISVSSRLIFPRNLLLILSIISHKCRRRHGERGICSRKVAKGRVIRPTFSMGRTVATTPSGWIDPLMGLRFAGEEHPPSLVLFIPRGRGRYPTRAGHSAFKAIIGSIRKARRAGK